MKSRNEKYRKKLMQCDGCGKLVVVNPRRKNVKLLVGIYVPPRKVVWWSYGGNC